MEKNIFVTLIIIIVLFIFPTNSYTLNSTNCSTQFNFDYEFTKSEIDITETFDLNITIVTDIFNISFVDFQKNDINEFGFYIKKFDYTVRQIYNVNDEAKIIYSINFEIGMLLDKLTSLGKRQFPPFEIHLIPINNINEIEIYRTEKKIIEIFASKTIFNIYTILIIVFTIIVVIILAIVVIFKRKNNVKTPHFDDEQLSENTYKKFIEKKEFFVQNKDINLFLISVEKLLTSYILRKYHITNFEDFYSLANVSTGIKNGVKELFDELLAYKTTKLIDIKNKDFKAFEVKFKTFLYANSFD